MFLQVAREWGLLEVKYQVKVFPWENFTEFVPVLIFSVGAGT